MDNKFAKIKRLENNEEAIARINAAESGDEILCILRDLGVELTAEELAEMILCKDHPMEFEELDEDYLKTVSGGGLADLYISTVMACVRARIWVENYKRAQAKKVFRR